MTKALIFILGLSAFFVVSFSQPIDSDKELECICQHAKKGSYPPEQEEHKGYLDSSHYWEQSDDELKKMCKCKKIKRPAPDKKKKKKKGKKGEPEGEPSPEPESKKDKKKKKKPEPEPETPPPAVEDPYSSSGSVPEAHAPAEPTETQISAPETTTTSKTDEHKPHNKTGGDPFSYNYNDYLEHFPYCFGHRPYPYFFSHHDYDHFGPDLFMYH